jgi:hypothetical protein
VTTDGDAFLVDALDQYLERSSHKRRDAFEPDDVGGVAQPLRARDPGARGDLIGHHRG